MHYREEENGRQDSVNISVLIRDPASLYIFVVADVVLIYQLSCPEESLG